MFCYTENMPSERQPDNRMSFIRTLEDDREKENLTEYEYASESHIAGELSYSNDNIGFRFLTFEKDRNGLQSYVLRLLSSRPRDYSEWDESTTDGYYFQGGDPEELISLFSLFFRKRFFRVSYTYRTIDGKPVIKNNSDFSYTRPDRTSDPVLFETADKNAVDLEVFINTVRQLNPTLHSSFANAVRLYALALREIGVNEELAFIHLVSAIEIVSKNFTLVPEDDPIAAHMDTINTCFDTAGVVAEIRTEVKNSLNNRKARMKFVRFIQSNSNGYIVARPETGAIAAKIYTDNLEDALKRIYNARSKFLHEGSAMYTSYPRATMAGADYDGSVGQRIDNRRFEANEQLPLISFFEKLVNVCLINYLESNLIPAE